MKRKLWTPVVVAAIAVLAWFAFATFWAWKACWNYASISANADYWGQVSTAGFGFFTTVLLVVTLWLQHEQNTTQLISSERSTRIETFFKLRELHRESAKRHFVLEEAIPRDADGDTKAKLFQQIIDSREKTLGAISSMMSMQVGNPYFTQAEREALYFGVDMTPPQEK